MRAAVMHRRHLNIDMVKHAIGIPILDAEVRDVDLVIEVRQVVFPGPVLDLPWLAIGPPVDMLPVAIPGVQPFLVLALELVIEQHPLDASVTLGELRHFPLVGSIHLRVVFNFPRLDQARMKGLTIPFAAGDLMRAQEIARAVSQRNDLVTVAGHPLDANQALVAQVSEIAGPRIGCLPVAILKVSDRDDPERPDGRERPRL
jgi:hypothetical protein